MMKRIREEMDHQKLINNLRGEFPEEYVKEAADALEELLKFAEQCHDYFDAMPYDPRDDFE